MAVKCILTGQTPSVLDGVTENVQSQIDNKVDKVTGKGLSTEDYTSAEKTKLGDIEEGAQKNTVTSVAGKTGEVTLAASDVGAQPKITVNGILQGDGNGNITAVESIGADIVTLDKSDVGLGNVDNTSDADKPISTATQTALDDKQPKITADGILKGDGTGTVTAAEEAEVELVDLTIANVTGLQSALDANKGTALSVTLASASWTGTVAPYTYTISNSAITATTNQELTPATDITADQLAALQSANIIDGGQAAGSMTLKAFGEKPSVDIPVRIIVKG